MTTLLSTPRWPAGLAAALAVAAVLTTAIVLYGAADATTPRVALTALGLIVLIGVLQPAQSVALILAALSAAHLAAILLPDTLRRLYIVRDNDPAGDWARDNLIERADAAGIEAIVISPELGDFNEDLRTLGLDALRMEARLQVAPQDVARFMALAA